MGLSCTSSQHKGGGIRACFAAVWSSEVNNNGSSWEGGCAECSILLGIITSTIIACFTCFVGGWRRQQKSSSGYHPSSSRRRNTSCCASGRCSSPFNARYPTSGVFLCLAFCLFTHLIKRDLPAFQIDDCLDTFFPALQIMAMRWDRHRPPRVATPTFWIYGPENGFDF